MEMRTDEKAQVDDGEGDKLLVIEQRIGPPFSIRLVRVFSFWSGINHIFDL